MIDARYLAYDHDEEALGFGEPPRPMPRPRGGLERLGWSAVWIGAAFLLAGVAGIPWLQGTWLGFLASFGLLTSGAVVVFHARYAGTDPGIKHDDTMFSAATYRGWIGWTVGIGLTAFYLALYFQPELESALGISPLDGFVSMADPLARAIFGAGAAADRWFFYGLLYTLSVLVFGVRMLYRYRHSRYHLVRTCSVIFFQLGFAFLIPQFLKAAEQPEFYFSYFWPLKPEYLFPSTLADLQSTGALGTFMVFWGVVMALIATPVLTYFYGKRWYCSWVCGCGGLAETLGDPYRHLSDKSTRAWTIERWLIYSVLAAIVVLTILLWTWPAGFTQEFKKGYAFAIGQMFSGVIGVGFYPLLGSRVWCRFGCPLAAILGIVQRTFSRFRITTNGGQCMSCGNCSTYCEMGIDVRAYAQQGKNIVRASCVGCGVCSSVCPRGVLKLENGKTHSDRYPSAGSPLAQLMADIRAERHIDPS